MFRELTDFGKNLGFTLEREGSVGLKKIVLPIFFVEKILV